jgi:hypothetical protein
MKDNFGLRIEVIIVPGILIAVPFLVAVEMVVQVLTVQSE